MTPPSLPPPTPSHLPPPTDGGSDGNSHTPALLLRTPERNWNSEISDWEHLSSVFFATRQWNGNICHTWWKGWGQGLCTSPPLGRVTPNQRWLVMSWWHEVMMCFSLPPYFKVLRIKIIYYSCLHQSKNCQWVKKPQLILFHIYCCALVFSVALFIYTWSLAILLRFD